MPCGAVRKRFYSGTHFPQCRGEMAVGTFQNEHVQNETETA